MSLLDDVSIVVTPNGYKAGELYAVVPNPVYGEEEVVNGDFSDGLTGWDKSPEATLSVTNDQLDIQSLGGSGEYGYAFSTINFIAGKTYVIDLDVISTNVSTHIRVGASADFNANPDNIWGSGDIGIGSHSIIWVATNNYTYLGIGGRNDVTTLVIDNVSVKEVITASADMDVTRATAATRVDENGLVNYAEVIGSELAICGDFECASPLTGWTVNSDGAISIDSGKLKVLNVTNRGRSYRTYTGLTIGKTYEAFVGNISGDVGGYCHITSGTANNNITLNASFFFVAGATTADFQCGVNSTVVDRFTFFDNISLKQNDRDNVPRIDYTGGGCPHILAEPQRTNLITYSEDFSQTDWQKIKSSVTSGFSSPDGGNNSYRWQEDTNSAVHSLKDSYSFTSVDYSQTIFIKPNGRSNVLLWVDGASKGTRFDLSSGTIHSETSSVGKITAMNDGWFKISTTVLGTSGTAFNLYALDNFGNISYTGDGTSGFYVYGAQLEQGSYPTSYIPTSGSTVTRNQDIFTRDGIGSLINSTEGVLFVEMAALSNDGTFRIISLTDGGTTNRVSLIYNTSNNNIRVMVVSTSTVFDTSNSVTSTLDFHKIAIKWKLNDFAVWIDGVEVATDTSGNTPVGLDRIVFDVGNGTLDFYGKVKQLQVYKTALTDAQLTSLTS